MYIGTLDGQNPAPLWKYSNVSPRSRCLTLGPCWAVERNTWLALNSQRRAKRATLIFKYSCKLLAQDFVHQQYHYKGTVYISWEGSARTCRQCKEPPTNLCTQHLLYKKYCSKSKFNLRVPFCNEHGSRKWLCLKIRLPSWDLNIIYHRK